MYLDGGFSISIYLKNRLLPNMFTSWLPQIMLHFCLGYWNPVLWCFIAIFKKLPLSQSTENVKKLYPLHEDCKIIQHI